MTRTGTSRQVDGNHAFGRLRKALAFHEVARLALEQMDRVRDPDPVSSNGILAAIAYTDALTAAYLGRVNQKDHATAVKLLRDALGKALPDAQERRLARLLGRKDEIQYGARQGRGEDAGQTVAALDEFAAWAKSTLAARSVVVTFPDESGRCRLSNHHVVTGTPPAWRGDAARGVGGRQETHIPKFVRPFAIPTTDDHGHRR